MGPRKLAPKLPANSSSASSAYTLESNPQSQSQSQEPQPSTVPIKPKRAQVRAACVACQRGKAKVSQKKCHHSQDCNDLELEAILTRCQ
jgi:hypothetical protein